ncbi:MAG: 3-deoxy-7-phosphoheptulonate synthase, partial [Pygmaiobacter sp.]
MIIIFKKNASAEQIDNFKGDLKAQGLGIHESIGENVHLVGLVGDVSKLDIDQLAANDFVEEVKRISEPYKAANRKFHPADSVIDAAGVPIGGGSFVVMAGPCSVESEAQIIGVAESVKSSGAAFLRGGAFKPRTSPYSFQGLRGEGLELLRSARRASGLPIVTEIMNTEDIALFDDVDVIQVGARNMQNFELLKALGRLKTPILLKRGLSATIEEWLMSAEYIMAGGNENVILCERGIRTFETSMRNTLDLSAVPMLKSKSHLPVIVDPSHAAGIAWMVEPLALAAIAAGADGLMIEVHNDPKHALSDGAQSLTPEKFDALMHKIRPTAEFFGKQLACCIKN